MNIKLKRFITLYFIIGIIIWLSLVVSIYQTLAKGRNSKLEKYNYCESVNYIGQIDEYTPCSVFNKVERPAIVSTGNACVWTREGSKIGRGNICGDYNFWKNYSPVKDTLILGSSEIWLIIGWPLLIVMGWLFSGAFH